MKVFEIADLMCDETQICIVEYNGDGFADLHTGAVFTIPMELIDRQVIHIVPGMNTATEECTLVLQVNEKGG